MNQDLLLINSKSERRYLSYLLNTKKPLLNVVNSVALFGQFIFFPSYCIYFIYFFIYQYFMSRIFEHRCK